MYGKPEVKGLFLCLAILVKSRKGIGRIYFGIIFWTHETVQNTLKKQKHLTLLTDDPLEQAHQIANKKKHFNWRWRSVK